jgi:hypothetical protein
MEKIMARFTNFN